MTNNREIYTRHGLAIINPSGGVWTHEIFKTPEDALAYLKKHWKDRADFNDFKLALATQTVTVYRPPGEATFVQLPQEATHSAGERGKS